ncbi:TonB-dependent siderophore receptor [Nevskia ramosa]|uniref:TonB-dependent siderophore receptor n=1 Tax=Nevskia ramosa TaxID=64002 RepID=UPI003D105B9E
MPAAPSRRHHFPIALALTLGWPVLAVAADDPAAETVNEDKQPVMLGTVTVAASTQPGYTVEESHSATKLDLSLRDTPQSITVITRQRMDDQNLQSLRSVLDNTTGVYSYAYDSERVVFTSRGFLVDNTLYDGIPVASDQNTSAVDATLDTALFERIEIVRGATGLLTGAGSPSAAVNLVRKHADSRSFDGEASFVAGSWNNYRAVGDLSTPLNRSGTIRARVVGVYQNADSYTDLYNNEKTVFYGVVDADLAPRTRLSVGYGYQQTLPQANTWGSFPLFFSDGTRTDWKRSVTTAAQSSYWNIRTQNGFAQFDHAFDNGWTLRTTAQRRIVDGRSNLYYLYGFPDPVTGEGLVPFAYRANDANRQTSVDTYLNGKFDLFGRKHEFVLGALGSWLRLDTDEFAPGEIADPGNFFKWDGSVPPPEFASEGSLVVRDRTRQSAAYSALRLSLADPLRVILGARYSSWKSDRFDLYGANEADVQNFRKLTPYAGAILDLSQQFSLFTSYTKIFNPQNNLTREGQYLDPLDGRSLEAGIKGSHFDSRLNTALTFFDTRQDNAAIIDEGHFVLDDETRRRQAYLQVDGTRTRGVEADISGQPIKDWNLSIGVSHYAMKDGDGNTIKGYIPRTLVRSFTTYRLGGALQDLTIGGGVNWQSENHVSVESPSGFAEVRQRAYSLLGLMARYRVTSQLSVQLNGENLLDEKYYVIDEYGNLYYGPPASVSATVRYGF